MRIKSKSNCNRQALDSFEQVPRKEAIVWLRPGLVAFGQTVSIQNRTSNKKINYTFKGDNRVLLEDVRTRADRIEPFYDKVEVGARVSC